MRRVDISISELQANDLKVLLILGQVKAQESVNFGSMAEEELLDYLAIGSKVIKKLSKFIDDGVARESLQREKMSAAAS